MSKKQKITNYDRVMQMKPVELAYFLAKGICDCPYCINNRWECNSPSDVDCEIGINLWLNTEVIDDDR